MSAPTSLTAAMARLLLRLESDAFADARPCPFCDAVPATDDASRLPHAPECELDRVLSDSGLRVDAA